MLKLNINSRGFSILGKMTGGYFITTVINNALPFLLLPVLTKYLVPADYANIALFTAYVAIACSITGATINAYVAKIFFEKPPEYVRAVIGNSIFVLIVLTFLFGVILIISYYFFPDFIGLPLPWVLMIPLGSITYLILQILLGVLRNQKKVFVFSYYQLGNTILNVVFTVLFVALFFWGWRGRILSIVLATSISSLLSLYYLKKNKLISIHFNKNLFKSISQFVLTLIPNSLQSVIVTRVGVFFMQYYFTKELLGIYSVGFQVAYVVMIILITLNLSWSPFLYEQLSRKEKMNKIYVVRMLYAHLFIALIGAIGVNLASGFVIKLMTTEAYQNSIEFIPFLTAGMFFNGASMLLMPILIQQNKHKYISIISIINLGVMFLFYKFSISIFDYMGVAYAYFLTYVFMFVLIFIKIVNTIKLPWLKALIFVTKK